MTSFALRSKYIGLVTNLLANDLSNLDERIFNIFTLLPFVICTIGYSILVVNLIGIAGLVGVISLLLSIPMTHLISKANGNLIRKLATLKDWRIQVSTEVIEGIKYIKLYGW